MSPRPGTRCSQRKRDRKAALLSLFCFLTSFHPPQHPPLVSPSFLFSFYRREDFSSFLSLSFGSTLPLKLKAWRVFFLLFFPSLFSSFFLLSYFSKRVLFAVGVSFENQVTPFFLLFFLSLFFFFSPLSRKGEQRLTEAGERGSARTSHGNGGPGPAQRGPGGCAPPPPWEARGVLPRGGSVGVGAGAPAAAGCRFLPKCGRGPPSPPLPSQGWKAGCVLYLCIFKVGRWAWNKHPRRALNCKRAFKQLFAEPWTARLEGAARAASARAGVGRGSEQALGSAPRGLSDLWAWAPAPPPGRTAGGRRGVAVRGAGGQAPGASPRGRGLWHSLAPPAPPPQTPLRGRPDLRPPTSGTPAARSRFSTPTLGRSRVLGLSRAEPPGRVNYSWGAWACSQDLLCPQLLRRSGEKTREKFPEQSWPRFSFSQVSIEHLLDA
ncbi:uncharacterized protein LOC135361506 [Mirounga angustirostris]|uniref:uncharacterized protein LOC135361506 n=1 Tax=Mirounga angustirostris TaxID=9716 RepID=UPI00313CE461